jgi:hypothetical protein
MDGKRYVDTMDRTRMVIPQGAGKSPTSVSVRVYFKVQGGPPRFAGLTDVPRSLFSDPLASRIGFVPIGAKPRED